MGLFSWFSTKSLSDVLNQSYDVKIHSVRFKLRKLDPLSFMGGYKALIQPFELYKPGSEKQAIDNLSAQTQKIKDHFTDVFMYSVIEPVLVRKQEEHGGIWVGNLFTDWTLAEDLYHKIMEVTYGKKKMRLLSSRKNAFPISTS